MGNKKGMTTIQLILLIVAPFLILNLDSAQAGKKSQCRQSLKTQHRYSGSKKSRKSKTPFLNVTFQEKKVLSKDIVNVLSKTKRNSGSIVKSLKNIGFKYKRKEIAVSASDLVFLEKIIKSHYDEFTPSQLSQIFVFYSRVKYSPNPKLYNDLINKMQHQLPSLSSNNLSFLLFSLSKMGLPLTEKFMTKWFAAAHKEIHSFTENSLSISMYAFGLLKLLEKDEIIPFLEKIKSKFKNEDYRDHTTLGLVANYYRYVLNQPSHYLKKFDKPIVVLKPEHTSRLEDLFAKLLHKKRKIYQSEFVTELGTSVDFYTELDNTIYQIDGPTHFIFSTDGSPKRQRLKDQFIDEIHKAMGYTVIRRSYDQVENEALHL